MKAPGEKHRLVCVLVLIFVHHNYRDRGAMEITKRDNFGASDQRGMFAGGCMPNVLVGLRVSSLGVTRCLALCFFYRRTRLPVEVRFADLPSSCCNL